MFLFSYFFMKPYVILNAAMSLDGKIATKSGESKFSSKEDLCAVHRIRAKVDAIMVGINTVLRDNPQLTIRYAKGKNPIRIVIDSRARTPLNSNVLKRNGKALIVVSEQAPKKKIERLREKGAKVLICGRKNVNLKKLMELLNVKKILLDGGATLNWSMIKGGLVDEIRVAISPIVVGGREAIGLVEGSGFSKISSSPKFRLKSIKKLGNNLVLNYVKDLKELQKPAC